jgi:ADP-glucose pyrophosphorylase
MAERIDSKLLAVIPAGGEGTRLRPLTHNLAKPALPITYTPNGDVQHLIDIPIDAVTECGGHSIVARRYLANTLDFLSARDSVSLVDEVEAGSPIDTIRRYRQQIDAIRPDTVCVIPGDADIDAQLLRQMLESLDRAESDALMLGTVALNGHNTWPVDKAGNFVNPEHAAARLADLGVHVIRYSWLTQALDESQPHDDIWALYRKQLTNSKITVYAPEDGPEHVDLGTPRPYFEALMKKNAHLADRSGNIVFPYAQKHSKTAETIMLPQSSSKTALKWCVVPVGIEVEHLDQTLNLN